MSSFKSACVRWEIKLFKPFMDRLSLSASRFFQDMFGVIGARFYRTVIKPFTINSCDASFVEPKTPKAGRVILYLHGGAYVSGCIEYAQRFARKLAFITSQRVLCIAYRLAPEDPYPAAVEDALAAYDYLLNAGYKAQDISLAGESAGGGLAYSLCLMLKLKGEPLPSKVVGISPWADLTLSGASYKSNRKMDPVLSEKGLRRDAALYAAGKQAEPLVSPVFGDLGGFPPSLIFAGGGELLLDDAKSLANRLTEMGSQCELIIEDGLWHVYVLFNIPEAKYALKRIAGFLG